jgi:UPF0176 protein
MPPFINISSYRFIQLAQPFLIELKRKIKTITQHSGLKGTIILSSEGIKIFLTGQREQILHFQNFLNDFTYFKNLFFQESFSNFQPFKKMLIKVKNEIIPFNVNNIHP